MNQRIKLLAEQATVFVADYDGQRWQIDPEKFAELIVQECMKICEEQRAVYFGQRLASDVFIDKNMYAEGEAACEAIRYNIKQHFGVKE